ncbi:PD-(D/E)XK nuclease family transposase [Rickettsia endosymbiont of Seladonia tumulorum]|uniref:PD-(D/E)XK nuclease family transposase n=1 Tax=Rickettsia endosymbiont of Seladonia tumulorum TaxID=3066270 RepID=UPI00313E89DF
MELHTIELNKFAKGAKEDISDIVEKVKNALDMWLAFLTRHDLLNKDNLPKELDNKDLKKALTVLEIINFTKEEREEYEDCLKWLRIETNTLKKAEARGEARGEARRNVEIAKNLLLDGININTIMRTTGLIIEEIEKLKIEIEDLKK